jgi:hypothetical protein
MYVQPLIGLYTVAPQMFDDAGTTALLLSASAGATAKILTLDFPCVPIYFGYRPTQILHYGGGIATQGVLGLYKYPAGVAANKILLAQVNLLDASAPGGQYMSRVPVTPPLAVSEGHAEEPAGNIYPGDVLAFWVVTGAAGSSYLSGLYQPVLVLQRRGASYADMAACWFDQTPAPAGISKSI